MCCAAAATPRKKLPPPTTRPDRHAVFDHLSTLPRRRLEAGGAKPERSVARHYLATEFEQYSAVWGHFLTAHAPGPGLGALHAHVDYSAAASPAAPLSPTLKRTKRATEMFSPSLAILDLIQSATVVVFSLMNGCSIKQISS